MRPFGPNGTIHKSGGVSVLDGSALLFYIGLKDFSPFEDYSDNNHAARNFNISLRFALLDISVVGGGGSGSGGLYTLGGAGGGGARALVEPKGIIRIRIGGGMNTQWTSNTYGRRAGSTESHPGSTIVTDSVQSFLIIGYSGGYSGEKGGNGKVSNPTGFVHTSTGSNSGDNLGGVSVFGSQKSIIGAYDKSFEPDFGGRGQCLNGFSSFQSTKGSGLGGGGGGQNSYQYGGQSISSPGGRYGYSGGIANPNKNGQMHSNNLYNYGYGPSPGESNSKRSLTNNPYRNGGGGGSFGGGGGSDGTTGDEFGEGGSGAGGAVLIRINGFLFESKKPKIHINAFQIASFVLCTIK